VRRRRESAFARAAKTDALAKGMPDQQTLHMLDE
jgi:hypothetical protein